MEINSRREIELKIFLGENKSDTTTVLRRLKEQGFITNLPRIETDYLPDTEDYGCRKSGILFRIRKIETKESLSYQLTIKTRKQHPKYLDFNEIETDFLDSDKETFLHINKLLFATTGHKL